MKVKGKYVPCMNLADPVKHRPDPDVANEIRLEFESAWEKSALLNNDSMHNSTHETDLNNLNGQRKIVTFDDNQVSILSSLLHLLKVAMRNLMRIMSPFW